ncbi:opsin 6, group member b [Amia ocellicauda]|uniref:opsin 6, group member b n=1 Tax=Amia ocellicauda TaxID=2972642 RepID=UPI0034645506
MGQGLMDSYSMDLHNRTVYRVSEDGETAIGIYLITLGWLSWVGNGVVIFLLSKQRRVLEPHDYLTFNLAVSDASISIFGYSRGILEIFNVFRDDDFLIKSIWTCKVDGFLILLFGLISINTLTAISVIRYIKGCQPHQAYRINNCSVALAIVAAWLWALFWAGAPLLGWGSYRARKYGTCEIDWARARHSLDYKSYVVGIFFFNYFIPVFLMVFSYSSLIRSVRSSHKSTRGDEISERQRRMERSVTRVSFVVCTAFILAWSPYAVISLWSAWGFQAPPLASVLASLFAKSASFYNPLIYMVMSTKFRRDLQAMLRCLWGPGPASATPHLQTPVRAGQQGAPAQPEQVQIAVEGDRKDGQPVPDSGDSGVDTGNQNSPAEVQSAPHLNHNHLTCRPFLRKPSDSGRL